MIATVKLFRYLRSLPVRNLHHSLAEMSASPLLFSSQSLCIIYLLQLCNICDTVTFTLYSDRNAAVLFNDTSICQHRRSQDFLWGALFSSKS